jgi:hypothetical protein
MDIAPLLFAKSKKKGNLSYANPIRVQTMQTKPHSLDLHLMVRPRGEELFHLNPPTNASANQNIP